jgi:5,6-dimethylbenzimidazole synthase
MTDDFTEEEKRGFYKAIYSRRDVRSHFISKPIKDNILSKILHAAHHAPSVGFSQPWNFILIKDIETKKKIKKSFEEEIKISFIQIRRDFRISSKSLCNI